MKAVTPEDDQNKPNIVQTTIRFDADLHEKLNNFVHESGKGLPPRQRPSKDSIVQQAVLQLIERHSKEQNQQSSGVNNKAVDISQIGLYYSQHVVRAVESAIDAANALKEIVSEIRAATDEGVRDLESSDIAKRVRDKAADLDDILGAIHEGSKGFERRKETGKGHGKRRTPGGSGGAA